MAKIIQLNAQKREKAGKGASRALRKAGIVPAVIYGDKKAPVLINITEKALKAELAKAGFWTHQFEIVVDGEKTRTICQDVQLHPVSDVPLHADFLRIAKNAKLEMEIPLHIVGEEASPGLRQGGTINLVHRSLLVSCSPDAIPEHFTLDVSALNIGDALTTKDIVLPEKVTLTTPDELTLLTITETTITEEEPTPAEAAPAAEAAAPAAEAKTEAPAAADANKPAGK